MLRSLLLNAPGTGVRRGSSSTVADSQSCSVKRRADCSNSETSWTSGSSLGLQASSQKQSRRAIPRYSLGFRSFSSALAKDFYGA
jgi:hypothetical protein